MNLQIHMSSKLGQVSLGWLVYTNYLDIEVNKENLFLYACNND